MLNMDSKLLAAEEAVRRVKSGMVVGLGTGSTSARFIALLGAKVRAGSLHVKGVPTSLDAEELAHHHGIPLLSLEQAPLIHLAVDGADLVDKHLNLIKGGGGAHAREKVVDYAAKKFVVIVDESKLSPYLKGAVPLEILPFAFPQVKRVLQRKRVRVEPRAMLSDNGNVLADAFFPRIPDPAALEQELNDVPGLFANGIFSRNVSEVIVGTSHGVRVLRK